MFGKTRRSLYIVMATLGLGSCAAPGDQSIFSVDYWQGVAPASLFVSDDKAELGIAEMAKGNLAVAEAHFNEALRKNRMDVQALLGLGMLYQNRGEITKAREVYEAILAIRPSKEERLMVWNSFATKPIAEIASVNLALMESGRVPGGMETSAAGYTAGAPMDAPMTGPMTAPGGPVGGAPAGSAMFGRPMNAGTAMPGQENALTGGQPHTRAAGGEILSAFVGGDANMLSRFRTLHDLRDQGLITQEEFTTRRQANLGALMPLTSPPPAAGLDRPVPTSEQISSRLRAIGRALEMRAITVSQHSAERGMILDALMPDAPVVVANPGQPPQGLMQAADSVRKLDQLQSSGLLTTDEYTRERNAIEGAMQSDPGLSAGGAPGGAPMSMGPKADAPKMMSGPQPAVHLASYRSRAQADRGWAQLRRAHRDLLGDLQPDVQKVDLRGKGTFYRLKAGPLESPSAAKALCRKLKSKRQFCEPGTMEMG